MMLQNKGSSALLAAVGKVFCFVGHLFFCFMACSMSKDPAYANGIGINKTISNIGFVPTWACTYNNGSLDKSQPFATNWKPQILSRLNHKFQAYRAGQIQQRIKF